MPPTDKTPIIARTPSISIIERPTLQTSLRGVQRRSNPEPLIELLLNLLFPNVWFFMPNSAKTRWAAKNMPLIRFLGFAERERELWIAYISSFFPLKLCCLHSNSITSFFHKSTGKIKALLWSKVCKKNDRLKWTVFRLFFIV